LLGDPADDLGARRIGQPRQFVQVFGEMLNVLGALAGCADQNGAFDRRLDGD
jgi:hypothetical protein